MPNVNWISNGRKLDKQFLLWLRYNPTIVIPKFSNIIFPPVRFTDKKKLITVCWDENTFYYNVNRNLFPNIQCVMNVGPTKLISMKNDMTIIPTDIDSYYRDNQILWRGDEWVNEEWLSSQFNEFFARCQQIYQNELRKQMK